MSNNADENYYSKKKLIAGEKEKSLKLF